MDRKELIKKYLDFFEKKGHKVIKSASLFPENDASTLFISAGMHPLVPYLLGEKHPFGKRLADVQKCLRTGDIEDVGDSTHNTFFEMLGNWSLGDYFKKESITWSYEFLTKELKISPEKINVTVFEGNANVPKDEEAAKIWISAGIPKERIFFLPEEDNFWWAGATGPCGPDTEIFIDTGKTPCSKDCRPGCKCSKYVEIWNNVFMAYTRDKEGNYAELKQKNVDTGMGVERTIAMLEGKKTIWETSIFSQIINLIKYESENYNEKSARIVVDHIRAAVFILADDKKIVPSNKDQGYVLRRLIRKAIRHAKILGLDFGPKDLIYQVTNWCINEFKGDYPELERNKDFIESEIGKEKNNFLITIDNGLKEFDKISTKDISAKDAFFLYQSFGFPIEMTAELAGEKGINVDINGFNKEFEKHQELSKNGAEQKFKGGLADSSEATTNLHTATHMLNAALTKVLGKETRQRGSNITPERLRFDFNFDRKLTDDELRKIEGLINEKISESLPIIMEEMGIDEAKSIGAKGEFGDKYGEKVKVYFIGDFSKEICGGPHANNTKELGHFKIIKEEAVAAGVRRIKAILE
jgi:alanyl-tRNA synthetase